MMIEGAHLCICVARTKSIPHAYDRLAIKDYFILSWIVMYRTLLNSYKKSKEIELKMEIKKII
ncbi:MAG: hypothetical protein GY777_29180 [Candidatus Brocadiaceae bacterium]|nr:hypothetical protein [Candidatus Brocadiaceae bacterium]